MCTWITVGQGTWEKTVQRDPRRGQVSTLKSLTTFCPPTNFENCSVVLSENLGRKWSPQCPRLLPTFLFSLDHSLVSFDFLAYKQGNGDSVR